jgi:hypothetical protein
LAYYVESYVRALPRSVQDGLIADGYKGWADAADLKFTRVTRKGDANIVIQAKKLDGPGKVLAQAQLPPGDDRQLWLQMDDGEQWATGLDGVSGEILYLNVFRHEAGHNLGLEHSTSKGNGNAPKAPPLMAPYYNPAVGAPQRDDDIARITELYGKPAGAPVPPPAPTPQPPTGGAKVTKEELQAYLLRTADTVDRLVKMAAALAAWVPGVASLLPWFATLGTLARTVAGNDFLLTLAVMLINSGLVPVSLKLEDVPDCARLTAVEAQVAAMTMPPALPTDETGCA